MEKNMGRLIKWADQNDLHNHTWLLKVDQANVIILDEE